MNSPDSMALPSALDLRAAAHRRPTAWDDGEAFDRVSSLHRLLLDAIERGDEREILVTFTDALIAWDNVEVRAYVEDMHGGLTLGVATPGTNRLPTAALADRAVPPDATGLVHLSSAEAAGVGLHSGRDVVAARVGGEYSQPWLVLLAGEISSHDEVRLALYVDLLREAVARAAAIKETRTSWAILQQLLSTAESIEQVGDAALGALSDAADVLGAALVVTAPNGVHVLSLGDAAAFSAPYPGFEFNQLVATRDVLDAHTMVLAVRRAAGHAFTRREQRLIERAAATFAAWLPGALRGAGAGQDRRVEGRDFDRVLDRAAAQSLADGLDVVLLVLVAPGALARPGLLHKWVTDIRGQLRASDLAGALSDREIGVLLSATTPPQLPAVGARILRHITIPDAHAVSPMVTVGVASQSKDTPLDGSGASLVRAARHNAAQRVPGGEWP